MKTEMEIRKLRLACGISQEELASKLGVKRPSVVQWEQNKNFPAAAKLPDMADIFGCTIDALFGRKSASA